MESGRKRGRERIYDAQRTREAILNAAEAVFAAHGFDGTSVDAIAAHAGYNKSLLFQYFGDKLGLYSEVLKRIDRDLQALEARLLPPLSEQGMQAREFRAFLTTVIEVLFDYLLEHPHFLRMLTWETAEGWQTYRQIISHLQGEETDQFQRLLRQAEYAGWLRSGFTPLIQLTLILQICQSYLAYLPLYQAILPGENASSEQMLSGARDYLVGFILAGMLAEEPAPPP